MVHRLILFMACAFASLSWAQTGVLITYYDGNTQSFNVEASGKLYFSGDNLLLKTDNSVGTPTTIPVSIIQRITFSTPLSTATYADDGNALVVYPNPSTSFIRIKSQGDEILKINLYSLQGQLLLQGDFQSDEAIDVNALPAGLYFVQVNGLTLKFCKK